MVVPHVWYDCCKPERLHEASWQARILGLEPQWLTGAFVFHVLIGWKMFT